MDILEKLTTLVRKVQQEELIDNPEATVKAMLYGDGSGNIILWTPWALGEGGLTHALYSWDSLEHLALKLDTWLERYL